MSLLSLAQIIGEEEDENELILLEIIAEKLHADLELVSQIITKAKETLPYLEEHEAKLKLFTQLMRSNNLSKKQMKKLRKKLVSFLSLSIFLSILASF